MKKSSWPYRVYEQTFIADRSWLDRGAWQSVPRAALPEEEAYWNARDELSAGDRTDLTSRPEAIAAELRVHELREVALAARERWEGNTFQAFTRERGEAVKKRRDEGQLTICRYFWSVVLALVVYYPIVLPKRRIAQWLVALEESLERAVSPVLKGAGIVLAVFVLYLLGGAIYASWSDVALFPGKAATSMSQSWRVTKAELATNVDLFFRDYAEKRVREEQWAFYAKASPEWAHREETLRAAREQQAADMEWARTKRELEDFLWSILGLTAIVAIAAASLFALYGACWLICGFVQWMRKEFRGVGRIALLASAGRILRSLRRFFAEAGELVTAFAKAKKQRVCWFVVFED